MKERLRKYKENELNTRFHHNFTTGSYGVGIGRAWCSRKACEICSSLVQKKKLKINYFSSHKLPKQQLTSFWSQGILGVNQENKAYKKLILTHFNFFNNSKNQVIYCNY
jgi:hypothetical protein